MIAISLIWIKWNEKYITVFEEIVDWLCIYTNSKLIMKPNNKIILHVTFKQTILIDSVFLNNHFNTIDMKYKQN